MFCLRGEAALLLCPRMLGNQCSPVIEANQSGACLDIDMAANQRMRDGVRMFAVQHVIVGPTFARRISTYSYRYGGSAFSAGLSSCSYRLFRQPGNRRNGRSFSLQQLADGQIQRGQRMEHLMPQPHQDPALHDQNGIFDFGLSFGLRGRAGITAVL